MKNIKSFNELNESNESIKAEHLNPKDKKRIWLSDIDKDGNIKVGKGYGYKKLRKYQNI